MIWGCIKWPCACLDYSASRNVTYFLRSEFANISIHLVQITITQKGIKHVLRERWYAWEEASRLYAKGIRPEEIQQAEREEDFMEPETDVETEVKPQPQPQQ